jgi:hypothetical protein
LTAANYTFTFVDGTLTVNKAVLTVKANDASMTYGGMLPAFSAAYSGFANNDTASVLTGTPSFTPATAPATAGTSPITATQGTLMAANYTFTFVNGTLTVNKALLTVKADDQSKGYGAALPALTGILTGVVNGDGITATYATGATTTSPVGAYPITVNLIDPNTKLSNYDVTTTNGTLTINKALVTVIADNATRQYGDANPTFTASYSGFKNGETLATSGVMGTPSLITTATPASAIGSNYVITAAVGGLTSANYEFAFVNGTLTITARPVTVTADTKEKVYGAADPAFSYQITSGSLASGDAFSGALVRDAGENVGSYAIKQGTLALNDNYALTFAGASLTITARPVTVTADSKEKVYGAADPALTYQITSGSLASGDMFSGALVRDAGENVGLYAIKQGTLVLSNNYNLTYAGASLTITARPVTVMADAKEKVYGAADPALTYQITSGSLTSGDAFSGALVRDAGENVGSYAIKQGTLALSNNYSLTYAGASLTIDKAPLAVKADNASRLYGAANPAFTGTITGIQNGDSVTATYASSATAASAVGIYPIVPALSDPGNKLINYSVTVTNGSLTISQASLTVKADNTSRLYGAANPAFTGTITGIQNGDSIAASYTSSANAASAVGTYPIIPTLSDAGNKLGNYSVTIINGTLTVTPASLTITPAGNKSKILGSTFTAFTGTVSGLQNSDAVTVTYTSPGAQATAAIGTYDITVASVTFTSGSASNYNVVNNTASKGLTVSYNACLLYDPTRAVKGGATYPIKMYLCDINNRDVSSPGVVVNVTGIYQNSSFVGAVEDAGNANPDSNFRYDATLGPSGGYIFNLKTSGLGTGGYMLTFTASGASSSSYSVGFGVK